MVRIITPATTEPITLAEVRQHLRLPEEPAEDELLLAQIKTARSYCENFTRRALAEQTLQIYLDRFSCKGPILLPCPQLQSVVEIGYTDNTGTETILPVSDYLVDTTYEPGRVLPAYGMAWPVFTPYPTSPIRIRFVAGYVVLPEPIRQRVLGSISRAGTEHGRFFGAVYVQLGQYRPSDNTYYLSRRSLRCEKHR